ncbi:MAG TPA: DUF2569 family protein [Gemmatimonadaceae bacterium]|nr:DUF2569 family protein [Gemmatimonadaceae bacterium]
MKKLLSTLALLVGTACADQSVTQYVGTVMNDASPEAEGSLRLTLYTRTDTSFSGVIELGPPAHGTGGAYLWHEGSELRISSVAATGGDTIFWMSKLTDEGLGGKFEVTGGPRAGQGGTWRAHLTKGPPATPATLRLPNGRPRAPLSALWPIVLVLAIGLGLTRWVRRAPKRVAGDVATAPAVRLRFDIEPGVSGWLAFFVVAQAIGIIVALTGFSKARNEYTTSIGLGSLVIGMQPLLVLEMTLHVLLPLVAATGIVLVVRRSRYAPRFWFGWLLFSGAYLTVDAVAAQHARSILSGVLGASYDAATANFTSLLISMARGAVASVVWALYWARSERVRVTFGAAALDRTALPLPVMSPSAIDSPAPGRRRRIVVRTIGATVGVIVVLFFIGLWQTRVTAYSVPAGSDIRTTVAGQWTWTTDTEGCANAHTIAFSDDGTVMTIVQPSRTISSTDVTTTYDIKLATQSMIRGAIRGETRLDKDSKPVVWDLVLVGPNTYRWRRNDWTTAWGYTPSIVRCPDATPNGTRSR